MSTVFPELKCESGEFSDDPLHSVWFEGGLTKRELFAAMAMQGLLSGVYSDKEMLNEFTRDEGEFRKHLSGCEAVTRAAVNYADALVIGLKVGK